MFVQFVAMACFCVADDSAAKPRPAPHRFDLRWATQWLFGKRPAAPADAAKDETPKSPPARPDLSDSRLEVRCRSAVFADPALRASGMTVRVAEGVAHLEGTASSRWQRIRAEQLARSVPGVLRVENSLRVDPSGTESLDSRKDSARAESSGSPVETGVTPAAAPSISSAATVVSRPKTLPADDGESVVTTYTIRRATPSPPELLPAVSKNAAPPTGATPTKKAGGRLVPWDRPTADGAPTRPSSGGGDSSPPSLSSDPTVPRDPIDSAVRQLLTSSPFRNQMTFDRTGKDVVLRGTAPSAAFLDLAQQVSRIPGVGVVAIASQAKAAGPTQRPSTSDIE